MPYVQVERDGLLYETEHFYGDGMVIVSGIRGGQFSVDLNEMTETATARATLRNLIRENKIDLLSE